MKKLHFCLLLLVAVLAGSATAAAQSSTRSVKRNLELFNQVYTKVNTLYVDSIDADKAINTAITAMLAEVDPYTEFFTEEEAEQFSSVSTGEYGGLGAYLRHTPDGKVIISEPREGTPSALAGLLPGDVIIAVDGDSVKNMESSTVSQHLRGQAGTKVSLTVKRPYVADSILTFNLTRARIEMPTLLYSGVVRDTIGYIRLDTFNEKSYPEVKEALTQLLADPRVKCIALDLRDNGGGIVPAAVDIISLFVDKGTLVMTSRGKTDPDGETPEQSYRTSKKPLSTTIPLAVIINENSASAAEITAGALQDHDRAVIIGKRSFGKGLVQRTYPLPYGNMVKVTIAKYYLPSGRLIQAIDYSKHNDDGTVYHVPDSLTNEFRTAAGRTVRDGGGITPDIVVGDSVTYPRILIQLYQDNWIDDFAVKYNATHPTSQMAAPAKFTITDEIYSEFKTFVDPEKFSYNKPWKDGMKELRKVLKDDGYDSEEISTEIDRLEQLLERDLNSELDLHRKAIEPYIAEALLKRVYYNRGVIENSVQIDPAISAAIEVLTSPSRLKQILSPK